MVAHNIVINPDAQTFRFGAQVIAGINVREILPCRN